MEELIEVLKALSKDMTTGDIALFNLCERMVEHMVSQQKQIAGLLENQKLINQVLLTMSKSMEVQRDTIRTHTNTLKTVREIVEAYTDKRAH